MFRRLLNLAQSRGWAGIGLLVCCALAMWTDWQGYLLVILLSARVLMNGPGRSVKMAGALLLTGCLSGLGFLMQIHLALPGAWRELFHAFRERTGRGDLSGGTFTAAQWLRTEGTYLTTLFHPLALVLAGTGAAIALERARLSAREAALLETGAVLFVIDAFYVCVLRNQSYIHDFAGFYFLVPVAVFGGFLIERFIREIEGWWPGYRASAATLACCGLAAGLVWSGIGRLGGIDTQFCILDDDESEPATLMPDVGRLIDQAFPADAVVICNFDQYYSPLPYYARRPMVNDMRTYAEWEGAVTDAAPEPAAGIVWEDAPDAGELLGRLPAKETREVKVDGIRFVLWRGKGR